MNNKRLTWLSITLLFLGQAMGSLPSVHAGSTDLNDSSSSANIPLDKSTVSEGGFDRDRFTLTFDTRFGYDDNTLGQPDSATFLNLSGKRVTENVNPSSSAFFNFDLGVGYTAATPRLSLTFGADVGVSYYFDRPGARTMSTAA